MIRILLFSISFFFLLSCSLSQTGTSSHTVSSERTSQSYQESLDPDTRVEFAKKRKSYISGIRKWDYYSLRNNPEEALSYYLQVAEKLPKDQVVRKKIAHVYYLQKNWKTAYNNYVQVPISELSSDEKEEMLQSLFFDESQLDRIGEILKIPMGTGSREYYRITDTCNTGIHNCIIAIQSYSGSSENIRDLQEVITGAILITSDYQYRNLLVAAKFYEQKMYGVSSRIAQEILKNKPDYMEAVKILWFSHYELWNYGDAKQHLLSYIEKNPEDLESVVRLGQIYAYLNDIVASNLSLNNAILAGYHPKTDLERRLAYNYSLLGDTPALMRVMNYLLQESDVREDDYAVWISLALSEWELQRARTWSEEGMQKFKNSSMLAPLYIEALRLMGERDAAQSVVDRMDTQKFQENPNLLLQKWVLLFDAQKYDEAKSVFQSLSDMEDWPGVLEEATAYLTSIESMTNSWSIF